MPRSIALVANAASRSGDPDLCAERLRGCGAEVQVFDVGEAERAAAAGAERVAVAGGDGSIAPVAAAAGAAGLPLAVIPMGTANDFARATGLPSEFEEACRLAVQGEKLRDLELGHMGERPFVNVASAGLPGPAARTAKAWKKPLGALGYAAGALVAGATSKALPVAVECGDEALFEGDAWQVTLAASGHFGGGSHIADADPQDGALDVVAVEAGPRPGLVALAYRLRAGSLPSHRRSHHRRCATAVVRVPDGTEWNVDGELVEAGTSSFRGEPRAFLLVVP